MRKIIQWTAGIAAFLVLLVALLFSYNGLGHGWKRPVVGKGPGTEYSEPRRTLRILALNAAKCSFHQGGLSFASVEAVKSRLDRIADVLRAEHADLVFLSEVVMEAGPVPIDQVEYLARQAGFARFASAENYSFGLPFYRIRSGNAVLSNVPLRALETMQLVGERSIWNPTNNRRALWFELSINDEWLLGASIRNDSFDLENNRRQVRQLLDFVNGRPALLAGDFNAEPGAASMALLDSTGRFSGLVRGPATFPARSPSRRIDQILAPSTWTLTEQHVVDTGVSDHLAVVATFALP